MSDEAGSELDFEPKDRDQVIERCSNLFNEKYLEAKNIHLKNEDSIREQSWMGLVYFREALNSTANVFKDISDGDINDAKSHIDDLEEYIYLVACESAQTEPIVNMNYVERNKLPNILYQLTLSDAPTNREYRKTKKEIEQVISKGKEYKPNEWQKKYQMV